MVIFLQLFDSGNAISIVATHMSLFIDLFAFISFKSRKTQWLKKIVISKILKNCQFSNLHIFRDYQMLTNFTSDLYWTLLAL